MDRQLNETQPAETHAFTFGNEWVGYELWLTAEDAAGLAKALLYWAAQIAGTLLTSLLAAHEVLVNLEPARPIRASVRDATGGDA